MRPLPCLALSLLLSACADRPAPVTTDAPAAAKTTAQPPAPLAGAAPAGHDAQAAARVAASMDRFASARSFHAEMTLDGAQSLRQSLDFVAPDRYRIVLPAGPQVIVGGTLYLQAAGRTNRVPVEDTMLTQWRDPLQLRAAREHLWVQPQGQDSVDGQSAEKYRVVSGDSTRPVAFEYWIGADGRPLRLRHQGQGQAGPYTMTMAYTRFDDSTIRVDVPH